MATSNNDPAAQLQKLGERLRESLARRQRGVLAEKERNAIHAAVKEQWLLEKSAAFTRDEPLPPSKDRDIGLEPGA